MLCIFTKPDHQPRHIAAASPCLLWQLLRWFSGNHLNTDMPRTNPILARYKKRAPTIPGYTCADIDRVIDRISAMHLTQREHQWFITRIERLRASNEALRDSSQYWYDIIKSWLK